MLEAATTTQQERKRLLCALIYKVVITISDDTPDIIDLTIHWQGGVTTGIAEEAPEGWVGLDQAAKILGVARQTVLHRVQRGELNAVHVRRVNRKGLRIQVEAEQPGLFATPE